MIPDLMLKGKALSKRNTNEPIDPVDLMLDLAQYLDKEMPEWREIVTSWASKVGTKK